MMLLLSPTFLSTSASAQITTLPNHDGITVYPNQGWYTAKDFQNNIIINSNIPEAVIQTALDRGGDIYIAGGTYNLSTNFSGFNLKSDTHLKLAQDAYIVVPSGYRGHVFGINSGTSHCIIEGGDINEAPPVKRNWIGILLRGGAVSFNLVENMVVTNPFIVIEFNTTSPNYISANTFYNINGNYFVRGIEFDFSGEYIPWRSGFFGNTFRDLQFESGTMTTYGVKDIKYYLEAFYNVIFWDLPPNAISASIDPLAENNIIIGGTMTIRNFEDKSGKTIILDTLHPQNISNSTLLLEILNYTYNSQSNIPTHKSHQVLNMSISSQTRSGFIRGNEAQLPISVGKPAFVNIFGTVLNPKGGSISLSITRPDGSVEQNKADVTAFGAFYYPMIFDTNSLMGQYQIDGSYQNSNLGSLFLNVTSAQLMTDESNVNPYAGNAPSSEFNTTLSTQIKNDAKLWSENKITDEVFGNRIQYLVKIGILEKNNENYPQMHQLMYLPTWLKNNAGWWVDGQISDRDFISTIQYLLNNGLIQMPTE